MLKNVLGAETADRNKLGTTPALMELGHIRKVDIQQLHK